MAAVNVGEIDFDVVATAAANAWDAGEHDTARRLDKLARKINCALTRQSTTNRNLVRAIGKRSQLTWRDCPSTLPAGAWGGVEIDA